MACSTKKAKKINITGVMWVMSGSVNNTNGEGTTLENVLTDCFLGALIGIQNCCRKDFRFQISRFLMYPFPAKEG